MGSVLRATQALTDELDAVMMRRAKLVGFLQEHKDISDRMHRVL